MIAGKLRVRWLMVCAATLSLGLRADAATTTPIASRVGLVGATGETDRMVALATAQLSSGGSFTLVDRQDVSRVLEEQKLSIAAADANQAVSVGRLLNADLLAVVDLGGVVVFDVATGLRVFDGALPENIERGAAAVADGVRMAAVKKRTLGHEVRILGMLPARNADLPRDRDGVCEAVALLLERRLLQSADVAVLERTRLEQLNREQSLPGDAKVAAPPILSALVSVQVDISRGNESPSAIRATAILTDGLGNRIAEATINQPSGDAALVAMNLTDVVLKSLNAGVPSKPTDRAVESTRFAQEARLLSKHGRYSSAHRCAEAAFALSATPASEEVLMHTLWACAIDAITPDVVIDPLGGVRMDGFEPIDLAPERLEAALSFAERVLPEQHRWLQKQLPVVNGTAFHWKQTVSLYDQGLAIFPLDGSPVRRVTQEEGLPSNRCEALACFHGKVYIGSNTDAGYLLAYDPTNGGAPTVVASSLRKERQSPLDDAPKLRITFLVSDPPRDRLLVGVAAPVESAVAKNWDEFRSGMWALHVQDGTTRMKQIATVAYHFELGRPIGQVGNHVNLNGYAWTLDFDLATDAGRYACMSEDFSGPRNYVKGATSDARTVYAPGWIADWRQSVKRDRTVVGSWLWMTSPFSRLSADAKTVQLLDKHIQSEQQQPIGAIRTIEPLDEGQRVIVGNADGLWIVTPPPDEASSTTLPTTMPRR